VYRTRPVPVWKITSTTSPASEASLLSRQKITDHPNDARDHANCHEEKLLKRADSTSAVFVLFMFEISLRIGLAELALLTRSNPSKEK
jgi:hypothetical protein